MADNPLIMCFMDLAMFLSPYWLGLYRQHPNRYFEVTNPTIGYSFSIRYVDLFDQYQISYTDLSTNERTYNFHPEPAVHMQWLMYLSILAATARMQDSDI